MFYTLKLSLDEINYILTALADKPWAQVESLIGKIRDQALAEIAEVNAAETAVTDEAIADEAVAS